MSQIGFNTTYVSDIFGSDVQGQDDAGDLDAQSASGALASYMTQNKITSLDPNQLYKLAFNPPANASSTVSNSAKWMLKNSGTYNKIEQHDVHGSDGISGANNFQWAAQGGLGLEENCGGEDSDDESDDESNLNAQSASGTLAAYMDQHKIGSLNPNQLYALAYHPPANTPSTVSDSAKWMLQHPKAFNKIETHDVPGADGIAGVNDFQWAAQGGLGTHHHHHCGGGSGGDKLGQIFALLEELEELETELELRQLQQSGQGGHCGRESGSGFGFGFGIGPLRA